MGWLDTQIRNPSVIDTVNVFRALLLIIAVCLIGYAVARITVRDRRLPRRRVLVTNAMLITVSVWAFLQEWQQFGRPMLVWRLPIEFIYCAWAVLLLSGWCEREERAFSMTERMRADLRS